MKKTFVLAIVVMMAICTISLPAFCINCYWDDDNLFCDSYTNISQQRDVAPFSRVNVSHALTVNIVQGDVQSVIVKADDSVVDMVKTEVHDGVLHVYIDDDWHKKRLKNKSRNVIVDIVVPELTALDVNGASDVKVSELRNEYFTVKASGASDVVLSDIIVNGVATFEISGASNINAVGKSEKLIIKASGASDVETRNFETKIADVHASGASDVDITAYDEIHIDCSGASDVDYYGHPKAVDVNSSGASDVNGH